MIGVIPARYASQRLPGKPIIDLLGTPLIQRVYEQAKKSKLLHRILVATDDPRIEKTVLQFGGEVIMTSTQIASGSDRVAAVAEQIEGDIFVNIQGDEPLISPEMIDQGAQLLIDDSSIPVGTLVKELDSIDDLWNPNVVKVVVNTNGCALYFSRSVIPYLRDEIDTKKWLQHHRYFKHIGLYVYRKEFLSQYPKLSPSKLECTEKLEQLRILENGYSIKVGVTSFDSIPVDTIEDVQKVIELIKQRDLT